MSLRKSLEVPLRVLRCEGPRAVYERAVDELLEARRRGTFAEIPVTKQSPVPILNVIAAPLDAKRGGVSLQIRWRKREEEKSRRLALLFPIEKGFRLEVTEGERGAVSRIASDWRPSSVDVHSRSFGRTLDEVASALGVAAIHIEGTAGLPLGSLVDVAETRTLLLSIHDFSLFCPRPHLLERPVDAFCNYCSEYDRCRRCLQVDWEVEDGYQIERRRLASRLLDSAAATVWPSEFLLEQHHSLFPGSWRDRARLIEPPCFTSETLGSKTQRHEESRIAFLGGLRVEKGARLFAEAVRRMQSSTLRFVVYGGLGDDEVCRELRSLRNVEIRGYYRGGSLPKRLRVDGIDVALLLSIVPESFSLALSECVVAGIPVIALARGALAERVPRWRGALLSPETAVESLVELLKEIERDGVERVLTGPENLTVSSPLDSAQAHVALYRELGIQV